MTSEEQYVRISTGENPDYVISYNKLGTSNQSGIMKKIMKAIRYMIFKEEEKDSEQPDISKLRKAIEDMKFKVEEKDSKVDANRRYILVYVDKDNLSTLMDRAEKARIPITLRYKVKDFKVKKGDNHVNGGPRDNHDDGGPKDNHGDDSPSIKRSWLMQLLKDWFSKNLCNGHIKKEYKKRSWLMQLLKDWFSINLYNGYIKIEYKKSKHSILLAETDDNPFEDSRVRGHMTHDLLKDINISNKPKVYMGLEWMRSEGYIDKYFICHNKNDKEKSEVARKFNKDNTEKQLSWVKQYLQSVTWIRQYFGEKVAFVFAWHSIYLSYALSLPAILGVLYNIFTLIFNQVKERQPSSYLDETWCFDGPGFTYVSVIYFLLMAFVFPCKWYKANHIYKFKWSVFNYFFYNERMIVKHEANYRPVSKARKLLSKLASTVALLIMVSSTFGYHYGLLRLQNTIKSARYIENEMANALVPQFGISLFNTLVLSFVINPILYRVIYLLTCKEHHYYHSDFERSFTWKIFVVHFFHNNLRLLMMVFDPLFHMFGTEYDFCMEGSCIYAIVIQVGVFITIKPFLNRAGILLDWVIAKCKSRNKDKSEYDEEYDLYSTSKFFISEDRYQTLLLMHEKITQYGYLLMFGCAAPCLSLLAFVVEISSRRFDLFSYFTLQRRPIPRRHEGVGIWVEIMELNIFIAIFVNIAIIFLYSSYDKVFVDGSNQGYLRYFIFLLALFIIPLLICRTCVQYKTVPEKVKKIYRQEREEAEATYFGNDQDDEIPGPSSKRD